MRYLLEQSWFKDNISLLIFVDVIKINKLKNNLSNNYVFKWERYNL